MKKLIVRLLCVCFGALLLSCDDNKKSDEGVEVLSSFKLNITVNNSGIGQPAGTSLFVVEKNVGLSIQGQDHDYVVIEETAARVVLEYSGGPLEPGVTGTFTANLGDNTFTLVESVGRDMEGTLEVLEVSPDHTH